MTVSVHDIMRATNRLCAGNVFTKARKWPLPQIRFAAYRAARDMTGRSYPILARIFGLADHTSIMHGCSRADPALTLTVMRAVHGVIFEHLPDEFMTARSMFASPAASPVEKDILVVRGLEVHSIGADSTTRGSA